MQQQCDVSIWFDVLISVTFFSVEHSKVCSSSADAPSIAKEGGASTAVDPGFNNTLELEGRLSAEASFVLIICCGLSFLIKE